jgi:pimeloyl-ACP methyl ester carboxylesterase
MLFRFGEALAAAGFDCYSVDQAGYGESPRSWSLTNILRHFQETERALGTVDVFIGHSMGSGVGALVALVGLNRLRMPRLILAAVIGLLALGCLALQFASAQNNLVWLLYSPVHPGNQLAVVVASNSHR